MILEPVTLEPVDGYAGSWKREYLAAWKRLTLELDLLDLSDHGTMRGQWEVTVEAYEAMVDALPPECRWSMGVDEPNIMWAGRPMYPCGRLEP